MDNGNKDVSIRLPMPKRDKNEVFAIVDKRLGGSRLNVSCADGKSRMARIPGSKRRRIKRLKIGDLLIVRPWDIQDEKAEVLFSYRRNQAKFLSRINKVPDAIDIY